jgi:hypothetical protein
VADETASTETSQATTETATETTAETAAATETAAETTQAGTEKSGELETTALGGGEKSGETIETEQKAEVPETYELTAPEGFEKLDDEAVAAATPVFKELGLSNEQANKLIPVVGEYAKRIVAERDQQLMSTILEQRKDWLETARKDPEIGGANWDATMQASGRALDQLGFPKGSPLRNALDESGFGNHPEMIRFAAKVGKAIGEDSDFVRADANTAVKPKSDAELFYPSKKD